MLLILWEFVFAFLLFMVSAWSQIFVALTASVPLEEKIQFGIILRRDYAAG
jgi:hypothetical protein